jgi:hypothetical protein
VIDAGYRSADDAMSSISMQGSWNSGALYTRATEQRHEGKTSPGATIAG